MRNEEAKEAFIKEAIILFGFFNGLWIKIGINPETELLGVLRTIVDMLNPSIAWLFTLLPFILLIITLA